KIMRTKNKHRRPPKAKLWLARFRPTSNQARRSYHPEICSALCRARSLGTVGEITKTASSVSDQARDDLERKASNVLPLSPPMQEALEELLRTDPARKHSRPLTELSFTFEVPWRPLCILVAVLAAAM